jgi:hypothetical protein
MSRPLIQKRIGALEAMFNAEQGDPDALRLLESELAFRSVPRATTLLDKVKRVLAGSVVPPSPMQDELFTHQAPVVVQVPLLRVKLTPSPEPAASMSLDEARKVLGVTVGASWEVIENARREIVDHGNPAKLRSLKDSQRTTVMLEATHANAAYAVLRERRGNSW